MIHPPLLLVSCTRCGRLHVPHHSDAAHPLCGRCVLPARHAAAPDRRDGRAPR